VWYGRVFSLLLATARFNLGFFMKEDKRMQKVVRVQYIVVSSKRNRLEQMYIEIIYVICESP